MLFSDFKKMIQRFILKSNIEKDFEVTDITTDSREIKNGSIFFALKGTSSDGHDFIQQAISNGAACIIGEKKLNFENYIQVNSVKELLFEISASFYGNPQQFMDVIGITGTNGKTTTTYMIEQILSSFKRVGVIGTVEYRWNGNSQKAANTTPFIWTWYKILRDMYQDKVDVVVSEVSSHALDQKRVEGTLFDIALFTNFSRDHLDYHENEENYFNAKKLLFTKYLKKSGKAIVNIDDLKGKILFNELQGLAKISSFSIKESSASLFASEIEELSFGVKARLNYKGESWETILPMVGIFNLYNMMGALLACEEVVHPKKGCEILQRGISVPGRMEKVGNFARIFVDYAHSPDALLNILKTLNNIKYGGKIITVFGAGGNRDAGKRPEMGSVAESFSDFVIVTNDNPRKESPEIIIENILSGISNKSIVKVIPDRSEAIKYGVSMLSEKDILVVAGKGHENYQILETGTIYFSDREEILKALKELGK